MYKRQAVTLTVSLAGKMGKAKHEIAKTQIGQLIGQLQTYQLEKRTLPKAGDGLNVMTSPVAAPTAAYYVDAAKLNDPWGNLYLLLIPGPDGHPFEIVSYGADAQPGGTDENADVSSVTMGK